MENTRPSGGPNMPQAEAQEEDVSVQRSSGVQLSTLPEALTSWVGEKQRRRELS